MRLCEVEGCGRKHKGRGLCEMHLQRFKNHGSLESRRGITHGLSHLPEYETWKDMVGRCSNPDALSHQELCERTGYSPDASTMGVILSKLRKLGLVEPGARRVPDSFMEAIQ
jgi:hypothetical protein